MSPHVNNFVTDLVTMAKAMEELPQVQHELEVANGRIATLNESLLARDTDLEQARNYAASLEQKVRDTEVAKDQAETMFLEADERTSRAVDFIKATFANAGALLQALEPAKPEEPRKTLGELVREANAAPQADSPTASVPTGTEMDDTFERIAAASLPPSETGVSVSADPTGAHTSDSSYSKTEAIDASASTVDHSLTSASSGESATDPTAAAATDLSQTASSSIANSTDAAGMNTEPTRPFTNRRYIDVPGWVSHEDWLAGGGTTINYYWREGDPV
jgi:hypothetical protein